MYMSTIAKLYLKAKMSLFVNEITGDTMYCEYIDIIRFGALFFGLRFLFVGLLVL